MKWLVVLALAACGSKDGTATEATDRSCVADADCVLGVDACCTGCGGHVGEPVNRRAWDQARERRRARCAKEQCPDVDCAKAPECREEGVAVCKGGTCEREMRPTSACADIACETAADCTLFTFRDCCDSCSGEPLNKAAAEKRRGVDAAACAARTTPCPDLDCKMVVPDCVDKKCVTR